MNEDLTTQLARIQEARAAAPAAPPQRTPLIRAFARPVTPLPTPAEPVTPAEVVAATPEPAALPSPPSLEVAQPSPVAATPELAPAPTRPTAPSSDARLLAQLNAAVAGREAAVLAHDSTKRSLAQTEARLAQAHATFEAESAQHAAALHEAHVAAQQACSERDAALASIDDLKLTHDANLRTALSEQAARHAQDVDDLRQELAAARANADASALVTDEHIATLTAQLDAATRDLAAEAATRQELRDRNQAQTQEISTLRAELVTVRKDAEVAGSEAAEHIATLTRDLQSATSDLADLTVAHQVTLAQDNGVKIEAASLRVELDAVRHEAAATVSAANEKIAALTRDLQSATSDLADLTVAHQATLNELETLRRQLAAAPVHTPSVPSAAPAVVLTGGRESADDAEDDWFSTIWKAA